MAFVLVLQDDEGYCEDLTEDKEDARNVVIGYDNDTGFVYTFFISFYGQKTREISFAIFEFNAQLEKIRTILSAAEVSKMIDHKDRVAIKGHLMSCLFDMIERLKPASMFMCSVDVPLVSAAQVKYDDIVAMASHLGYGSDLTEMDNGQKFWWMERETGSKVGS
ncbi:hypothetical protein P7D22_13615 [Lichenihabitans sp. Uapishka_5]|uniref:hypothetical protein n=1 Tax=Lichenihabitans sp. Uapishka_5 TaxID=3037302 RepID=UPI0029E7F634|nr:hypothetical protein [Lichenihabitans sp. Uapishka_5]MDX7952213.1 hypothetical protein [Lichenihabitans sp. Uapishka_5]